MQRLLSIILFSILPLGLLAQVPTPTFYWGLNGNANASQGGISGNISGAISATDNWAAQSNTALNFQSGSHIELPNSESDLSFITSSGVFTIGMFVKIDDLNKDQFFISNAATSSLKGFFFARIANGGAQWGTQQLRFDFVNGSGYQIIKGNANSIADNNWHHIAVVGDGTSVQLYVDGQPDGTSTTISGSSIFSGNHSKSVIVGGAQNSSGISSKFEGSMDEVQVFNTALSAAQITELSTSTGATQTSGNLDPEEINVFIEPVSIGSEYGHSDYMLTIKGKILAEGVKVLLDENWPDYVFSSDYDLKDLDAVESHIKTYKHLPDVPSAKDIAQNGVNLGSMDATLLKKIEELTLYLIEINKRQKQLLEDVQALKAENERLKKAGSGRKEHQ